VKEILLSLKSSAEEHLNLEEGAVTRVVIGHPVVFPNAEGANSDELHKKALNVIKEAARAIGFREIQFVSEATASGLVAQISEGKILALDFGAGTFDVSTAECQNGQTTILATHGSIVGGNKIDLDLFDRLVSQRMGLGSKYSGVSPSKGVSNSIVSQLSSLNGFVRALHSRDIRGTVAVKKSDEGNEGLYEADALLRSGNGIDVYRAIQHAKAELSTRRKVSLNYQLPGMSKTIIHFPITVLNSVVDKHMPQIWEPIDQALSDSEWNDADVEFLLLTGGSSQLSRFRSLIQKRFNNGEIIQNDSFTSVVTGLAIWARSNWGLNDGET
jgi:hypothetical chaperone protein